MLAAAVTTSAMADTQTETLVNTSQSEASNVNHESEGNSIVFSKNDNMKDYTRTKRETGQTPAEPLNTSLLSDKSLTDMLISSTPTKSSVEQSSNFKLFESFHFPHPIDLPDSHDNVSCDSGSKSSDNLTDGINGANIERQLVLEAQLFDARKRIECLIASNQSATAQNELLNSEIDQYRKTIKEQKSQIKKLSNDNDNLRREISKYKGIRKYINNDTSGDMNDMVEKLNIAETKLSSFKQHVLDTANQLISAIDGDSAEESMIPVHNAAAAITRSSVPAATSRSASAAAPRQQRPSFNGGSRSTADQSPVTETPQVPLVLDSRVRTCTMRQPSDRPLQQPSVVLIGSSLVRDQGTKLRREGVDCECYTIGGGVIPHIRNRIPHILNNKCQPRYVHLTCGGNDLSSKSPENVRKDYDDLIKEVRRCCPDAVITLNTLPPRRRDIRLNERIKQLNDYIRNRATRGDGVKCHDDYPQFPKCFSPDQVHFNKAGKHVYARQLADYYVNFPPLFISDPR